MALTEYLLVLRAYCCDLAVPARRYAVSERKGNELKSVTGVRHVLQSLPPHTFILWEDVKTHELMLDARKSLHQAL